MSFSRRVLHMDPCPWPLRCKLADATGYPLSPLMSCGRSPRLVRPMILVRAPRVPGPTGTHGEPPAMMVRISLTAHENTPCSQAVMVRSFARRYSLTSKL